MHHHGQAGSGRSPLPVLHGLSEAAHVVPHPDHRRVSHGSNDTPGHPLGPRGGGPHAHAAPRAQPEGLCGPTAHRTLTLWHISCRGLSHADPLAPCPDPYCKVSVGDDSYVTQVFKRTTDPKWPVVLMFVVPVGAARVVFTVYDGAKWRENVPLGQFTFPLPTAPEAAAQGHVEDARLEAHAVQRRQRPRGTLSFGWEMLTDPRMGSCPELRAALDEQGRAHAEARGMGPPRGVLWGLGARWLPHQLSAVLLGRKKVPPDGSGRGVPRGALRQGPARR